MIALYTVAAIAVLLLLLLGLLRGLRTLGDHMRAHPADPPPNAPHAPSLPATGYLSTEEHETAIWCAETTRHDLERLDAICDRLVGHRLRVLCEDAIRQLLPPEQRSWVRLRSGDYTTIRAA